MKNKFIFILLFILMAGVIGAKLIKHKAKSVQGEVLVGVIKPPETTAFTDGNGMDFTTSTTSGILTLSGGGSGTTTWVSGDNNYVPYTPKIRRTITVIPVGKTIIPIIH